MRHARQAGFTIIEGVIIAVVVIALAGVGYWVFKQQSGGNKDKDATTSQTSNEDIETPAVPELNNASDLENVEKALDDVNLDAGTSDDKALQAQSNAF